jgi:manganese/iron transport system ATP-binding protein
VLDPIGRCGALSVAVNLRSDADSTDPKDIEMRDQSQKMVDDTAADGPAGGIMVRDVTVTYRNGHTALHDASFEIPRGTITALVGINGAGKSTLFKAIMGFVPAARGEIRLLGKTVKEALAANLVAYVPQSEEVDWAFPVLVEDVVMMGRYGHMGFLRRASKLDHAAVDAALGRVGMSDFRKRQIGELSGGQRKRVFLARSLAQDGQLILLDEPFTGVDVKTEEQIIALLRELKEEGRVMLVSTHNLGSVPEFCDRAVLVKGTVLDYGLTETTFTRDKLERAFGGVLRHFTLGGRDLHDDNDSREVTIISDDERPFVQYGEKRSTLPAADRVLRDRGHEQALDRPSDEEGKQG